MKSKIMVLPFLFVLFTVSYSSFSQNKTNETAAIKSLISKKEALITPMALVIEFNFITVMSKKQETTTLNLK